MGLITFLKRVSAGETEQQATRRMERARDRNSAYCQMAQWAAEQHVNDQPEVATDYADLQRFKFRAEHKARLVGQQSGIARKLGHARGTGIVPWLSVYLRGDDTVFCIWALMRDKTQNYTMMSPFWFLSKGEKEADFLKVVTDGLGGRA